MQDSTNYPALSIPVQRSERSQKDHYSNSIERLLKFVLERPGGNNEPNVLINGEKYLTRWSVNTKLTKSPDGETEVNLAIIGNLLGDHRDKVVDEFHDAGLLIERKENDLIKTTNGIYRLIGNIIFGSPNGLYNICLDVGGMPWAWRNIIDCLSNNKRDRKKSKLNFILQRPVGPPIKAREYMLKDQPSTKTGTTRNKVTKAIKPIDENCSESNVVTNKLIRYSIETSKSRNWLHFDIE